MAPGWPYSTLGARVTVMSPRPLISRPLAPTGAWLSSWKVTAPVAVLIRGRPAVDLVNSEVRLVGSAAVSTGRCATLTCELPNASMISASPS